VAQALFQPVDQHVAWPDFPLIKEGADTGAFEVLCQGVDPGGVGVAAGDEYLERAVHKLPRTAAGWSQSGSQRKLP